ncbi:MAG: zf-TFIIB domain-containing protein [Candidatus Delongbacteria bacterium]
MNCPRCPDTELLERERDGITLDGCPVCRGIWLDRGELERLIQATRKDEEERPRDSGRDHDDRHDHDDRYERHDRHDHHDHDRKYGPDKKRLKARTWLEGLGNLFD